MNKQISSVVGIGIIIVIAAIFISIFLILENRGDTRDINNFNSENIIKKNNNLDEWSIYRDDKHAIEFKYPKNWNPEIENNEFADEVCFGNDDVPRSKYYCYLSFRAPIRESGYELFDEYKEEKINIDSLNMNIDKYTWWSSTSGEGTSLISWEGDDFWKDSFELSLNFENENDPNKKVFDDIINSLRFTK